jgi:hypothetical protein
MVMGAAAHDVQLKIMSPQMGVCAPLFPRQLFFNVCEFA